MREFKGRVTGAPRRADRLGEPGNISGGVAVSMKHPMTDELRAELRRRYLDRNAPGYWGINARAWLRIHTRYVRAGYPDGFTTANQIASRALKENGE